LTTYLTLLCALVCADLTSVFAGTITIDLKMTVSVASGRLSIKMDAVNSGSEDARHVRSVLHVFDQSFTAAKLDTLTVQTVRSFHFDIPIPRQTRGLFPYVGELVFHDANMHPFSAVSAGTFKYRNSFSPEVTGTVKPVTLDRTGALQVEVINNGMRPYDLTATLCLPKALETSNRRLQFRAGAREKTFIEFPLTDRYGTGGSTYPVFCILEYDVNAHHQTVLLSSEVRIPQSQNWFVQTRWYWLAGLGGIAVIWIGIGVAVWRRNPYGRT